MMKAGNSKKIISKKNSFSEWEEIPKIFSLTDLKY